MPIVYTTGSWRPFAGQEHDFVERWKEFAAWASGYPGSGRCTLAHDVRDPGRYVSFIEWESMEAMRAWKADEGFKPRMGEVQKHIDKFAPTEIEEVASAREGTVSP